MKERITALQLDEFSTKHNIQSPRVCTHKATQTISNPPFWFCSVCRTRHENTRN